MRTTPAPSPGISYRLRIYRRARGKTRVCAGQRTALPAGEDEARDRNFEWEQEYDYKIAAVTVLAVPGTPAVEVEGDDSPLVHLTVHDVFPPAVPSGLQAVFSSVGQKPFIDLTWAPNTESDLAGYIVYRRSRAGSDFVAVSSAPVKAPAWRDNDVHPGQNVLLHRRGRRCARQSERAIGPGRRDGALGGSMKFCRFLGMEGSRFGLVETRDGQDFIISELGSPQMQVSGAGVPEQIVLPEIGSGKTIAEPFPLERAKLLTPFPIVSKILCVGRNYAAHVRELNHEMPTEPLIFSKPPSSLLAPGGEIVRPKLSQRVDYEGELGILIGRRCHKMKDGESAKEYILGYTVVNDVTARDLQKHRRPVDARQRFRHLLPLRPHRQHGAGSLAAASRCRPGSMASCARMATPAT